MGITSPGALNRISSVEGLQSVAAEIGAEYTDVKIVSRDEKDIATNFLSNLFRAPKPSLYGPVIDGVQLFDGDYVIYIVMEVLPGQSVDANREERLAQSLAIAQRQGAGDLTAYLDGLRAEATIVINEESIAQ